MTNNILDISRIESQTLNLDKEVINLDDLLLRIMEDYKSHIRKVNRNINNKKNTLQLSYNTSQSIASRVNDEAIALLHLKFNRSIFLLSYL